jgi:hypothetical protein
MFGVGEVVDQAVGVAIEGAAAVIMACFGGWWGSLLGLDKICTAL